MFKPVTKHQFQEGDVLQQPGHNESYLVVQRGADDIVVIEREDGVRQTGLHRKLWMLDKIGNANIHA